jgi:DNA-binding transcriptional MerR regulator
MSTPVTPSSGEGGWGSPQLTVAALARLANTTPDTVRYYEKVGLLPAPERSRSGYRQYTPEAVDRLHFIQGAQRLGLQLREIVELLEVRDTGVCPCDQAAVLLRHRMSELDHQIRSLSTLRTALSDMVDRIPSEDCPNPEPGVWKPPTGARTDVL